MQLTIEETKRITGGGIKWAFISILGSVATLLIGIIDGYMRPLKCNN